MLWCATKIHFFFHSIQAIVSKESLRFDITQSLKLTTHTTHATHTTIKQTNKQHNGVGSGQKGCQWVSGYSKRSPPGPVYTTAPYKLSKYTAFMFFFPNCKLWTSACEGQWPFKCLLPLGAPVCTESQQQCAVKSLQPAGGDSVHCADCTEQ